MLRYATNLSCRVDDFCREILIPMSDLLAECVLDRGVVALDEVAVYVADREGGLAWRIARQGVKVSVTFLL